MVKIRPSKKFPKYILRQKWLTHPGSGDGIIMRHLKIEIIGNYNCRQGAICKANVII